MKFTIKAHLFVAAGLVALLGLVSPVWSQQMTKADMEILHEKIRADKKLFVAANMRLSEAEAKSFWPIYDQYQQDLAKINRKTGNLLQSYANDYRNKTLTDGKAKTLIDEFLAVQLSEAKLQGRYVPKISMALPAIKVARYLQIENKIRAVLKYDLANKVPLVK